MFVLIKRSTPYSDGFCTVICSDSIQLPKQSIARYTIPSCAKRLFYVEPCNLHHVMKFFVKRSTYVYMNRRGEIVIHFNL